MDIRSIFSPEIFKENPENFFKKDVDSYEKKVIMKVVSTRANCTQTNCINTICTLPKNKAPYREVFLCRISTKNVPILGFR